MSISINERRLQMYITSRTKIIPDDAALYTGEGPRANHCLFCNKPFSKHPVISVGVDTYTFMCTMCKDEMLKELDTATDMVEWQKTTRKKELLLSLNPGDNFRIPRDIAKYFTHLNGSKKDIFSADCSSRCYICDRLPDYPAPYTDAEEFGTMTIPVRQIKSIYGGRVHICNDKFCAEVSLEYTKKLVHLQIHNKYSKRTEAVSVGCPTCRKNYIIVDPDMEIHYRNEKKDIYEWQCPECAYAMLNQWEITPNLQRFFPEKIGEPRTGLLHRHITTQCQYCNEHTVIDLTQTEFSFFFAHMFENKLICRECSILRTWFELETVLRILDTQFYIELHNSSNTFSVFRLSRGELSSYITNGNTNADNPIDNLFGAYDEALRLLQYDLEIWK